MSPVSLFQHLTNSVNKFHSVRSSLMLLSVSYSDAHPGFSWNLLDFTYEQWNIESNQSSTFWYLNPTNRSPSYFEFKTNQSYAFDLNPTNGKPSLNGQSSTFRCTFVPFIFDHSFKSFLSSNQIQTLTFVFFQFENRHFRSSFHSDRTCLYCGIEWRIHIRTKVSISIIL